MHKNGVVPFVLFVPFAEIWSDGDEEEDVSMVIVLSSDIVYLWSWVVNWAALKSPGQIDATAADPKARDYGRRAHQSSVIEIHCSILVHTQIIAEGESW